MIVKFDKDVIRPVNSERNTLQLGELVQHAHNDSNVEGTANWATSIGVVVGVNDQDNTVDVQISGLARMESEYAKRVEGRWTGNFPPNVERIGTTKLVIAENLRVFRDSRYDRRPDYRYINDVSVLYGHRDTDLYLIGRYYLNPLYMNQENIDLLNLYCDSHNIRIWTVL